MTTVASGPDEKCKVAVTGATGFVGRAVVSGFLRAGFHVVPVVRRTAGIKGERRIGDIGSDTNWHPILHRGDTVVHTAALAHGKGQNEAECIEVNVEGTRHLGRQAAEAGVRRLVFLSSVGVMGAKTSGQPFTETDPVAPHSFYARTKLEGERALWAVAEETGLEVVVVRPPLVYGPDAPGNFGRLVRWVERGWPLPLGAVESNRRSLVGLDNLVDLLALCVNHPAAAGETFLVADGEDLSTADLLRRTAHAMSRSPRLWPVPPPALRWAANMLGKGDLANQLLGSLQVDISKARDVLGWSPAVSVDEGLRRAVGAQASCGSGFSREE